MLPVAALRTVLIAPNVATPGFLTDHAPVLDPVAAFLTDHAPLKDPVALASPSTDQAALKAPAVALRTVLAAE